MSFLVWVISPSSLKCLIIMVNWIFDNHNIKLNARLKHMMMKPLKKFLMRPIWISFRGQTSRILKTWIDRICLNTFGIVLNNFSWLAERETPEGSAVDVSRLIGIGSGNQLTRNGTFERSATDLTVKTGDLITETTGIMGGVNLKTE